jgi:glycosyltransferase involved in cell wall biosynthesis
MKLTYLVTRGDSIGGAQVHVRDLATRAHHDGHHVLVVTGVPGPLTEQLAAAGVRTRICDGMLREISPHKDFSAVCSVMSILNEERPDLLSTHSSKAGVIGRIAARRAHVPVIFTAHGWAFTSGVPQPKRSIYRLIERHTARLADRIICVSQRDRELALAAGMPANRVVTIHNGMPDIDPALHADPSRQDIVRAVMTARFDRQKDHETLFRALLDVPDLHLDLIGDGPSRAAMEALASELGIADRIHVVGQTPNVAEHLAAAQLFVLSSHWEGFPRSTLEAMRAGLPVIVSRVGGAAEAVEDGITGYVVGSGDRDELAVRLRELVNHPERRTTMGLAGRALYHREFTFERMYSATMEVYKSVGARSEGPNSPG